MQEDLERRSVALTVNTAKMTGRLLLKLIRMYMQHQKNKKLHPNIPQGKQTVEQLGKQGQGMTNIEITDQNIKCFEKYAKKYGIDFALKKDINETPPKYLVFFKAKDNDAIMAAFKEFSAEITKKKEKPSVIENLKKQKDLVKNTVVDKVKHKEQVR